MTRQSFGIKRRGTQKTLGLLYIIIILLVNDEVHSAFEVMESSNPFSWERALHRCNGSISNWTIAVPAVDLTTMTVLDEIALKGEAWVGYFQSYEHFLYIGCSPLGILRPLVSAQFYLGRNANRPGLCYSVCDFRGYIGLQEGLCCCITTWNFTVPDTERFNSSCKKQLHCRNGMLCGDKGYSNISIYKKVILSSTDIKGDDTGCLIVKKDKTYEMLVVDCTRRYRHLCEAQNGQRLYLAESTENDQWTYSINHCLETGRRPTTFIGDTTNFMFPNVSRTWWTTVVRDFVIRNFSESGTFVTPIYEGFLNISDGVIQLEFVHERNNPRKKSVVCVSAGEKIKNNTLQKKVTAQEMTSQKQKSAFTLTSKTTTTPFVPGRKMQTSTPDRLNTPLGYGTSEAVHLTTSKANERSLLGSTVDLTVVLAIVGSFTTLLVISVLLNIYFIRKSRRMKTENTTELPYVNTIVHEDERGRNSTMTAAISTEIRSIPDIHCSTSTCMSSYKSSSQASYKSSGQEENGYITPIMARSSDAYDYIECFQNRAERKFH